MLITDIKKNYLSLICIYKNENRHIESESMADSIYSKNSTWQWLIQKKKMKFEYMGFLLAFKNEKGN